MDTEKNKILSNLKGEFESFGENYAPNKRQAANMYAQYQPTIPEEDFRKIGGQFSNEDRLRLQNEFLTSITDGDRKKAVGIAIQAEENKSGIPITYFSDILERDKMLRLAYDQDNSQAAESLVGPSAYKVPIKGNITSTSPLMAQAEFNEANMQSNRLTPDRLEQIIRFNKLDEELEPPLVRLKDKITSYQKPRR